MKAICINDNFPCAEYFNTYKPFVGEEVVITDSLFHPRWGLYYELEKGRKGVGYDANNFVPCLEVGESEDIEQKEHLLQEVI
jgi:hypothetical protein